MFIFSFNDHTKLAKMNHTYLFEILYHVSLHFNSQFAKQRTYFRNFFSALAIPYIKILTSFGALPLFM